MFKRNTVLTLTPITSERILKEIQEVSHGREKYVSPVLQTNSYINLLICQRHNLLTRRTEKKTITLMFC